MRKKTKYNQALPNFFVVLLCLLIFAGSIYNFFKDLNSSTVRTDKNSIASITFKYKIAQRKFNDRVVWERLQQNSPLYNADTIHTAELSQATIHFYEGTEIDISENTMIQIFTTDEGDLKLSVTNGQIEVDTTNSQNDIELQMGNNTTIKLETGSKINASMKEENSQIGIDLKTGNAKLSNKTSYGFSETIKGGQFIKIDENGKIAKAPITVTSISDNQKILIFKDEQKQTTTVPLEWFPIENEEKTIVVETSKKRDFSIIKDVYRAKTTKQNKIEIPREQGTIYWRAYEEGKLDNTVKGKIAFEEVPPINAIYPKNQREVTYYDKNPKIDFVWNGNDFCSKYKIKIAKDEKFENTIITEETKTQSYSVENLKEGKYYWKVIPFYEINKIGFQGETTTNSFEIKKLDEPTAPTLTFPIAEKIFTYTDDTINADFSWKAENVDSEYTILISKDKNFSDIIYKAQTKQKSFSQKLLVSTFSDGEYYWKVIQNAKFSENNQKILSSESRKFTVEKYIPAPNKLLYPTDNYSIESKKLSSLNFIWKISKENEERFKNEKTLLQFSKTNDFENPILEKECQTATLKNITLPPSSYFWRVKKGNCITESRTLLVLENLSAPKITNPKDNETIFVKSSEIKKNQNIVLKWQNNNEADFYKLTLIESETNKVLNEFANITENSVTIPLESELLNEKKKFTVKLQAFANETSTKAARKSEISKTTFSIKKVMPLKLISPIENEKLNGLSAIKNGVNLKWKKENDYVSQTLNLYKLEPDGKIITVSSIQNPKETENISRLTEGSYKWTVNATNSNGIAIEPEKQGAFTILKIPALPKPVITSPQNTQIIDGVYLKKNRAIIFKWNEVESATEYDFTLYQKMQNGGLKKIYSSERQKNTQIKFKNLKSLDVGTFVCQVQAKNCAKDGFIYQQGTATQEFTIRFSAPKKIETIDPGLQYGE